MSGKMLKLNLMKQKKTIRATPSQIIPSAAYMRVQKDFADLNLPETCETLFGDPDDLLNFKVIIYPDEGFYVGGRFVFSFHICSNYPHAPPKVKCETKIFHPNIDMDGNVCLNILREDWNPVLTVGAVIYGLQHLLLEPNSDDALNEQAGDLLSRNRNEFQRRVSNVIRRHSTVGNSVVDLK